MKNIWKKIIATCCVAVMLMTLSGVNVLADELQDEGVIISVAEDPKALPEDPCQSSEDEISIAEDPETSPEDTYQSSEDEISFAEDILEENISEELVGVGSYGVNLNSEYYKQPRNPFSKPQCTWYAFGRALEKTGVEVPYHSNAVDWMSGTVTTPMANSIAVWKPYGNLVLSTGHVAFVEKIENGKLYISEGNRKNAPEYSEGTIRLSDGYYTQTYPDTTVKYSYIVPNGYIPLSGGNYLNLGDDFYANIAATGFDNWIFLENHGGNVQLWDKANDYSDTRLQWHFLRQQDGSYRIISMYDGRYLNADAMGSAGYNVSVYSYLDWEAQNWFIIRNGNWYSFVPKYDTQICLDVTNAAVVGGTNIQLWNRSDGSEAQLFDIYKFDYTPVNISGAEISFIDNYVYNGKPIEPSPDVKIGDLPLIYDKHYTVSYSNNTNAGRATVTITGIGAYTGTITKAFSIAKASPRLKFASASLSKKTGDADFTNTLTKTTDGAVMFKSSNTSVATVNSTSGKVTIKGAGTVTITATAAEGTNYKSGSASYTLKVTASKTDISGCTITLSPTSYTYNGKTKKPTVTVTNGSSTLVTDTDYTVSYSNNTNAGTATVTITGKGNYTGTISKTFTISKAAAKLTFANASVSKTTKDAAFTNTLTKTTDGIVTFKSSNTNVATVNSTSGKVTIKGAGTATVTVTASAGTNYKAGSASYTLTVTAPSPAGFSDVQDPKHPYYKAIYWAAEAGITKGYSDGTFGINRSCTRGEMMMFLWKYAKKPAPKPASKSPFKDVSSSHAFYKAILWGYQNGITKGYSDGSFGINRNVSRGEAMMFLWKLKNKPAPQMTSKSPFTDVPTSHAFYKAILWGSQNGITKGYTSGANKGKFGINDNCTRGQIVTFLYRAK